MADLDELTRKHFEALKFLNIELAKNKQLGDYFDYLVNSHDSRIQCKADNEKSKKLRINENLIIAKEKEKKNFEINWNLEYCRYCNLSYWPFNCKTRIASKFLVTKRVSRLFTRFKLENYKPRYKSFKSKQVNNCLKRSIKLIYRCKRCKSKNLILKEINRPEPRLIKLKRSEKALKISNKLLFQKRIAQNDLASQEKDKTNVTIARKNYKSLQMKLKQSEMEQERLKNEQKNASANLFDFLQKLN
jgi:hypothetical protein